jgi:hypothetical protein
MVEAGHFAELDKILRLTIRVGCVQLAPLSSTHPLTSGIPFTASLCIVWLTDTANATHAVRTRTMRRSLRSLVRTGNRRRSGRTARCRPSSSPRR